MLTATMMRRETGMTTGERLRLLKFVLSIIRMIGAVRFKLWFDEAWISFNKNDILISLAADDIYRSQIDSVLRSHVGRFAEEAGLLVNQVIIWEQCLLPGEGMTIEALLTMQGAEIRGKVIQAYADSRRLTLSEQVIKYMAQFSMKRTSKLDEMVRVIHQTANERHRKIDVSFAREVMNAWYYKGCWR